MDDAAFIVGLMRTERDALGFIPDTAVRERWVRLARYVLQRDRWRRRCGYLLHGPGKRARPFHINQACIQHDHRLRGHGATAVREVIRRAEEAGATEVRLNCAADLAANAFWQALGFELVAARPGGSKRQRWVFTYVLRLPAPGRRRRPTVRPIAS